MFAKKTTTTTTINSKSKTISILNDIDLPENGK